MPIPIDITAIVEDLQVQLRSLTRAVQSQQATIDQLTDLVIEIAEVRHARR